jgi:hypothetical protein
VLLAVAAPLTLAPRLHVPWLPRRTHHGVGAFRAFTDALVYALDFDVGTMFAAAPGRPSSWPRDTRRRYIGHLLRRVALAVLPTIAVVACILSAHVVGSTLLYQSVVCTAWFALTASQVWRAAAPCLLAVPSRWCDGATLFRCVTASRAQCACLCLCDLSVCVCVCVCVCVAVGLCE